MEGGAARLRRGAAGLVAVLALHGLVAWLAGLLLEAQHNTLHEQGHWLGGKAQLDKGVIGGVGVLVTRPALYRQRLDLGAFFGYQQLQRATEREVAELVFSFRMREPTYLDVLFGDGRGEAREGVRLSRHPRFASLRYRVGPDGAFSERTAWDAAALPWEEGWNRASLHFAGGRVSLSLNGGPALPLPGSVPAVRLVGFRGSAVGPLVDDVALSFADGGAPWRDSFFDAASARRRAGRVAAVLAPVALVLYLALRARWGARAARPRLLTGYLVAAVVLALWVAVDHFHFSRLYPRHPYEVPHEGYDNRAQDREATLSALASVAPRAPGDSRARVLLVGTSQTWGSGARTAREALDRFLEDGLAARGVPAEVVNGGISGWRSFRLLEHYPSWLEMRPDLVVVNLSSNDRDEQRYREGLAEFARLNRARGIDTVFVLEPNSPEIDKATHYFHSITREEAARLSLPVVEAQRRLDAHLDDGFLWWDFVHLTSYGQRLLAEVVAETLAPLLARGPTTGFRIGSGAGALAWRGRTPRCGPATLRAVSPGVASFRAWHAPCSP